MNFPSFLHRLTSGLLIPLMILPATSCTYFRISEYPVPDQKSKTAMLDSRRTIVVHIQDRLFRLTEVSTTPAGINGFLDRMDRQVYYEQGRSQRYKKQERPILKEVHIYMNPRFFNTGTGPAELPYAQIREIRIIRPDVPLTALTMTLGVAGFFVAMALLALIANPMDIALNI